MRFWLALLTAAAFAAITAALFYVPLYRALLDPSSSTGSFELARAALNALATDDRTDVLVIGDSRIYSGLAPGVADRAAKGLRFINGGVRGMTPRCWYYFLQAVDPHARRFRALVIPVDALADDDSAIGSIDGDERQMDLHYVVFAVPPAQIPKLAGSFPGMRMQLDVGTNELLRGPVLRDDFQALLSNPAARFAAIADARAHPPYEPFASHPLDQTLAGLRVDWNANRLTYPPTVSASERVETVAQILRPVHASPSYARYRREWLDPIVERYAAAGTPVVIVRIPTRPVHRTLDVEPQGTLAALARRGIATLVPARPYLALERPELFADHDHLNRAGSRLFSAMLGADVARALARSYPVHSATGAVPAAIPAAPHALPWWKEAVGIGIPMQFQSYEFWIFVALVALIFYASPLAWRRWVLLLASYYFYARWNGWYVVFLLALTFSDWAIALWIERTSGRARRALVAAGVAANVAFLGTFKYANFSTGTVSALLGMHDDPWLVAWIVPIGISFHTFQSISYLVDVHRGKTPAVRKVRDYALYLAFFPQLLSGPIVRAGLFFKEYFHWRPPTVEDAGYAAARIAFGLFKKIAIADRFAPVVDAYFAAPAAHPGAPAAWGAMFAFSMQIYFDFSAYSDIAIGTARLFGFVFPENFNLPYLATSVTDFWHRWHITLSTWLRDYIYIPLGGSRFGSFATLRNLALTMLIGGLWHGAQWTFVAWGGLHGAFLVVERMTGYGHGAVPRSLWVRAFRVATTFAAVTLAWVLFRAPNFPQALDVYKALFTGGGGASGLDAWCTILTLAIVGFGAVRLALGDRIAALRWTQLPRLARAGTILALLFALDLLSYPGQSATFIYFKF